MNQNWTYERVMHTDLAMIKTESGELVCQCHVKFAALIASAPSLLRMANDLIPYSPNLLAIIDMVEKQEELAD